MKPISPVSLEVLIAANDAVAESRATGIDALRVIDKALSGRYSATEIMSAYMRLKALAQFLADPIKSIWVVYETFDGQPFVTEAMYRAVASTPLREVDDELTFDLDELQRIALIEADVSDEC